MVTEAPPLPPLFAHENFRDLEHVARQRAGHSPRQRNGTRIGLEENGIEGGRQVLALSTARKEMYGRLELLNHEVAPAVWRQVDQRHTLIADGLRQLLVERRSLEIALVKIRRQKRKNFVEPVLIIGPCVRGTRYPVSPDDSKRHWTVVTAKRRHVVTALSGVRQRRAVNVFACGRFVEAAADRICHERGVT